MRIARHFTWRMLSDEAAMRPAAFASVLVFTAAAIIAVLAGHTIAALPVAWLVLAINAALLLRFASAARTRTTQGERPHVELAPTLNTVFQAAAAEAGRRQHRHVSLEHVLLPMVKDESVAAVLRACGGDPEALATELADYLDLLTPETAPDSSRLKLALEAAAIRAVAAGHTQIDPVGLLVQIRRDPDAYASLILGAQGIELVDLLRCVSHGKPDVRPQQPAGSAQAALRLHNDDYTTMEYVVSVLRSVVGLDEAEAKQRMLEIHRQGSAVIATLPTDDAFERAERIVDDAGDAGYPLRCSVEAV